MFSSSEKYKNQSSFKAYIFKKKKSFISPPSYSDWFVEWVSGIIRKTSADYSKVVERHLDDYREENTSSILGWKPKSFKKAAEAYVKIRRDDIAYVAKKLRKGKSGKHIGRTEIDSPEGKYSSSFDYDKQNPPQRDRIDHDRPNLMDSSDGYIEIGL